jgi:hypothetical protein
VQDMMSGAIGSGATWVAMVVALVVVVLLFYLGVALRATLHEQDLEKRKLCYQLFRDLLDLFRSGQPR